MNERMTKDLVILALFSATAKKRPSIVLMLHSGRDSLYCAHYYQNLLKQFGMISSMSRKSDCWDNARMGSFWGILKNELVHHRKFKMLQQAIQEITEYIKTLYNRQRKQKDWFMRQTNLSPAYTTRWDCIPGVK